MAERNLRAGLAALVDRVIGADPGAVRLRFALRVLLAVVAAAGLLTAAHLPASAVLVGGVLALNTTSTLNEPTTRRQLTTAALAALAGAAVLSLVAVLPRWWLLTDLVFLAVIFGGVYLRRLGPRGLTVGQVAFMSCFFALFTQVSAARLPAVLVAALVGVAVGVAVVAVFTRDNRHRTLDRVLRALRVRVARLVDQVDRLLAAERATDRRVQRVRNAADRVHDCALLLESELTKALDGPADPGLRRRLVSVELAAERLGLAARRAREQGLPAGPRAAIRGELAELRVFLRRDPAPALAADEKRMLAAIRAADPDRAAGLPGTQPGADPGTRTEAQPAAGSGGDLARRVHRAVRELALAVVVTRRELGPDWWERAAAPAETAAVDEPADPEPSGLAPTTRQAVQAVVAGAIAIGVGELISPQRWYWAVITAFVVFAGTTSRGDLLVKGFRRVLGTLAGVLAGMVVAVLLAGHPAVVVTLLLVSLFLAFYALRVSYSLMSFFITVTLGLLYDLLGTFTTELFLVRLAETVVGAVAGSVAAVLVLPTRTSAAVRDAITGYLAALREFVGSAERLLVRGEATDLVDASRRVDRALDELTAATDPLRHRMSPFRDRRDALGHLVSVLDLAAYQARAVAAGAEVAALSGRPRVAESCARIADNLAAVEAAVRAGERVADLPAGASLSADRDGALSPAARRVLLNLDRLDEAVGGLARPLNPP